MKRKIIKLGSATLVTSLPAKWVRQYGLKAGDYLEATEQKKDLVLSTSKTTATPEKVLDCRKLDTRLMREYLIAAYVLGYHTIEILHDATIQNYRGKSSVKTTDFLQEKIGEFIGMEIVEQHETRTVIKELTDISPEELENTLRRIFYLLKELGTTIYDALKKQNRTSLEGADARVQNVKRFQNYFLRVLNKHGYTDFSKTNFMFVVADNLRLVNTTYRVIAELALETKKKYSQTSLLAFELTNNAFAKFVELFYNYKPETAIALIELFEKTKEAIDGDKNPPAQDNRMYANLYAIHAFIQHSLRVSFGMQLQN
ncbi:phosphate uptake regulator PhoU [Candidatus Woesearchaeota archaeon]|nr:phosphate uptake regulator PhoU [Candidatus Woesearchaeota archaeon]